MASGIFLVRPDPMLGESLSSWRQRLGLANGLHLFPIARDALRRVDPDSLPAGSDLTWLSSVSGLDVATLRSMSLQGLAANVFRGDAAREHPPWLLQAKYSASPTEARLMYCAACLRWSPAYIRLQWRLAFFTACPVHQVLLRDCCPHCRRQIWPAPATRARLFNECGPALDRCVYCRRPLHDVDDQHESSPADLHFQALLDAGHSTLAGGDVVTADEYFAALRTVCQVFLRRSSRVRIAAAAIEWSALAGQLGALGLQHHVEEIPLALRRRLIRTAQEILVGWPGSFVDFATQAGISYVHVSAPGDEFPPWFHRVADAHLRLQRRDVQRENVEQAIAALALRGQAPHKAAIQRELGGTYATVVDKMLSRRSTATIQELQFVLASYARERDGDSGRRNVRIALLRDHVVFYLAILTRRSFEQVLALSKRAMSDEIAQHKVDVQDPVDRQLAVELCEIWRQYVLEEHRSLGRADPAEPLFCLRQGTGTRPAQQRLCRHMLTLDLRLWRCERAFWRPLMQETCDGTPTDAST